MLNDRGCARFPPRQLFAASSFVSLPTTFAADTFSGDLAGGDRSTLTRRLGRVIYLELSGVATAEAVVAAVVLS